MRERFEEFIERHSLCSKNHLVLLAVSGGIDSMVMLDLFFNSGYRIAVGHVNFQLRGNESDGDEAFVMNKCRALGIEFFSKRVQTNNYATEKKLSIQMAARDLRYSWFAGLVSDGYCDVVSTAHHLNDSMETVMLNLTRGSGIDGFAGIPMVNGRIIRPLLFASRGQIESYASERAITWREDESNLTSDYQRNFLRHRVIPLLAEINPALEDAFVRTMTKVKGDIELRDLYVRDWKAKYVEETEGRLVVAKEGVAILNKGAILIQLLEPLGFNFATCCGIVQAIEGQSGKLFFSGTHQCLIDRAHLIVTRIAEQLESISIAEGAAEIMLGPFRLSIREGTPGSLSGDPTVAFLDFEKVRFPLTWRVWRDGDYFYPLGLSHRKKVSDFLTDLKLPLTDKASVTVLDSGNEIICLPGLRIDDRYKITSVTTKALVLRLERNKKNA